MLGLCLCSTSELNRIGSPGRESHRHPSGIQPKSEKGMKRIFAIPAALLTLFFSLCLAGRAYDSGKRVSFKLSVGTSNIPLGDFNILGESIEARFDDLTTGWLGTKRGGFNPIESEGVAYGFESMLHLSPNFALSFGLGYSQRSEGSLMNIEDEAIGYYDAYYKPKISVFAYSINLYFFHPVNSWLDVFVNSGVGLYHGSLLLNLWYAYDESGVLSYNEEGEVSAKNNGFGLRVGIGFEMNFGSIISLFVEGRGRSCRSKSWDGNWNYTLWGAEIGLSKKTSAGAVWILEQYDPSLNKWYSLIKVADDIPTSADIRNVREIKIDLSGFSIQAGIRIKI